MAWRKWFVRLLVFTIVGSCAVAVLLYQRFTNPTAVREQITAKLKTFFPGAVATIDSARLRILGGISVHELRLARKDDPDKNEILHVPSAVIYHDKEKILEGEWALRRVEFSRLHMRAQRNKDGTWNLQGITGTPRLDLLLPTIIIHHGTLVLEDRREGGTSVELTDVNLQIINDPLPMVTIEGSANSELAGEVHLTGQWNRQTQDIALSFQAERISLASIAPGCLEKLLPTKAVGPQEEPTTSATAVSPLEGLKLEGTADLKADLAYHPQASQPFSYDVWLNVTGAKIQHPKLPLPLEKLALTCHCSNGYLILEELKAQAGPTEITAQGSALLASIDQDFEALLEARHLEMNESLFAALPKFAQKLSPMFKPTGQGTFRADVKRRTGAWAMLTSGEPSNIQLTSETLGITFFKFPYTLDKLSGTVDMNLMNQLVQLDAAGYSDTASLFVKGTWQGKDDQVDCRFDIDARGIPLDDKIINALPPNFQKLAKEFNATGRSNIKAHIRHEPGAKEYQNEYHVFFYDTAIRWSPFPYPLENVTGCLDIFPKTWYFRDGRGTHHGADVKVDARSLPRDDKDAMPGHGIVLYMEGLRVPVDEDLHQAIAKMEQLGKNWETFRPRGQLNFKTRIASVAPEDADVLIEISGPTIEPVFFPYALQETAGTFHYHKNKLEIWSASARHRETKIALAHGLVNMPKGGGHYTDLTGLRADELIVDEGFIQALPAAAGKAGGGLRSAASSLNLQGPVWLTTRLVIAQEPGGLADISWEDCQCRLKNAKFTTGLEWSKVTGMLGCRGRYDGRQIMGLIGNVLLEEAVLLGQPFNGLQATFAIKDNSPDVLSVDNLRAPIFGGDISGQVRVNFNSTIGYELNLIGSQLDLGHFGRHNLGPTSQFQGNANARLHLTGQAAGKDTLEGHGSIDVPNGRLYNLPVLLDLLKFLKIRGPDHTSFEELHALFSIQGQRLTINNLELLGRAISLSGQGKFNLDGTDLAVDFYSSLPGLEQLIPVAIRPLPSAFSKSILTIEMRGKISADEKDRKFTLKPVPGVVNPILQMHNRLTGTPNPDPREESRFMPMMGEGK